MTNSQKVSVNLIRTAFESEHIPALFTGQGTHDSTLKLTGRLVHFTQDEQYITDIIRACLPEDYDGGTLSEVPGMARDAVRKGYDKRETFEDKAEKLSAANELIRFAKTHEGINFFNNGFDGAYASITEDDKTRVFDLCSTSAQRWFKNAYYKKMGRVITSTGFREAYETLIAKALHDSPTKLVFLRIARNGNSVLFNLANAAGEVIIIDQDGWEISNAPVVAFVNSSSLAPMPTPLKGDNNALREFQSLMGLSEGNFHRVLAFLINCLKPDGPYLFLLLEGEQGSGKSILSEFIKTIVDKGQARNIRLPDSARDLMIQAKDSHLIVFDNVSGIKPDISDALCSLATGGGYATRKLFTDSEQQIFNQSRPFILNGINGIASRPDLLERSLSLKLPSMPTDKRETEEELRKQFTKILPHIMAELFDTVACALQNFASVPTPRTVRMADAAKWLLAAEPATGLPNGTLLRALENSQNDLIEEAMNNNSLAIAIMKLLEKAPFNGTMGLLFRLLSECKQGHDRYFPPTPAHLSKTLERLRPALTKIGITVEFGPKTRHGKTIKIWETAETNQTYIESVDDPRLDIPV